MVKKTVKKKRKEKKLPVVLLEDIANLGQKGEVVLVKPGFYKYLNSNKKALLATKEQLKSLRHFILEHKIEERKQKKEDIAEKLKDVQLNFNLNIGEKNQVFNPITKEKIVKKLKEIGFDIAKSQIGLSGRIVRKGNYNIPIKLGYNIVSNIKVIVQ